MPGRLEGKVAFITGAARGQGRAHSIRMAEEGAEIIAVDICAQIESNLYPLATLEDLHETERMVKGLGRQIVARVGDVRERSELRAVVEAGVQQFGKIDILVAQAGILPMGQNDDPMDFIDATDVDLLGVMNAVAVTLPHMPNGSSIIVTGSTAAMMSGTVQGAPGGAGYAWAKNVLMGYTEQMALHLATRMTRVNCIHPTNCNTHLVQNEQVYKMFCPDIENPTRQDAEPRFVYFQGMPIPYIEPEDTANLAVFLASDEARYITGQQIRIDAASLLKFPNGPT